MIKILITILLLALACENIETATDEQLERNEQDENFSLEQINNNRFGTGENYLKIENVEVDYKELNLSFDISWDASWRLGESYDAAWVFVKTKSQNPDWTHANISSKSAKNTGTQTAEVKISPDGVGMFLYRAKDGAGDNDWRIQIGFQSTDTDALAEVFLTKIEEKRSRNLYAIIVA